MKNFFKNARQLLLYGLIAVVASTFVVWAAQTNYLGTVFIADSTTPANQLAIDGNGAASFAPKDVTSTASVSSAANLFSSDTSGYQQVSLIFTSIGSSNTVLCEGGNDNATWQSVPIRQVQAAGASNDQFTTFSPSLTAIYHHQITTRYLRCRVSSYSSGTVTAFWNFKTATTAQVTAILNSNSGVPVVGAVALAGSASSNVSGTAFTLTSAASTNATSVKASAANLYNITLTNNSATGAFLSFYNTAGVPTCGTGIIYQTYVSGTGVPTTEHFPVPLPFGTGLGICLTTGIAGTGAVAASAYTVSLNYK